MSESNSTVPGSGPITPNQPPTPTQPTPTEPAADQASVATSVILGIIAGIFIGAIGTIQHLHVGWLTPGEAAIPIPWGALFGLAILASGQLLVTLATRRMLAGGIAALATYTVAVGLAFWPGTDTLSVPVSSAAWAFMPAEMIAEICWLLGIPVIAIIMMLVSNRWLRRPKTP